MPYARIDNNTVQEVIEINPAGWYHPGLTWIATPNGVNVLPGWTCLSGVFAPPVVPQPTPTDIVAKMLIAGITVTSTGSPTLNATYKVDDSSRANIVAIETSLNAGRGFPPQGAQTFSYPDRAGNQHTFSQQNFTDFAASVRDFYYACDAFVQSALPAPPSSTVTID